jgi:hypothetical protein
MNQRMSREKVSRRGGGVGVGGGFGGGVGGDGLRFTRPRGITWTNSYTGEQIIKFWIARAMLEDCLQISFPAQSPGTL